MRLTTLRGPEHLSLAVRSTDSVRRAMQIMNQTGRTLVLVIDDEQLTAVIADGDIRRHLAQGGSTEDDAAAAANRSPITIGTAVPPGEIHTFMSRRGLEYLPIVDGGRAIALAILDRAPRPTDLTAVIMAGGLGSRLAPLTDNCPKPLLPLGGKPILSHILDHLQSQGVQHFILAVNHLAHMIVDHYDDGSDRESFVNYVHETSRLGTGGALSLVDLEALSDPFLCLNGDVLNDVDVGALRFAHEKNEWEATMVVRQHSTTVPYGVVDTDEHGTFVNMQEKPVLDFLINAGIYMLSKSSLDLVPDAQYYDLPTMFAELAAAKRPSGTYMHDGRWIDIGTTSEYSRAQAIFTDQKASTP